MHWYHPKCVVTVYCTERLFLSLFLSVYLFFLLSFLLYTVQNANSTFCRSTETLKNIKKFCCEDDNYTGIKNEQDNTSTIYFNSKVKVSQSKFCKLFHGDENNLTEGQGIKLNHPSITQHRKKNPFFRLNDRSESNNTWTEMKNHRSRR